ncbi:MAG: LLM class flavin-dependent oxidoreductase [Pyrinomonadaceae bacterium]
MVAQAPNKNYSTESSLEVFATCPQSSAAPRGDYISQVENVARWSEQYGCKGILVYTDNSLVDAWLVSQIVIQNTKHLAPLVAVQPVYMHPYTVAKMVASFGHLYGRRLYLNMVAGGFKNDLNALNDPTPHDQRYERLVEYTTLIIRLLSTSSPVSFEGAFYNVSNLKMTPPLPAELLPGVFVSGSSEAGMAAARAMGATAVQYPKPAVEYENTPQIVESESGVRVGIIARQDESEAWKVAHARFPEDRRGEITHQLAMKVSDSVWHKQLSELGQEATSERNPYWLIPFKNYKTFCPYLVGSYESVAAELGRYIGVGYKTFILDIPPNEEELHHSNIVFDLASKLARQWQRYYTAG